MRWPLGTEIEGMWRSWQLLNPLKYFPDVMNPKLDSQQLRHCLGEYFFVGSWLTTKSMSQNYLKIEHSEIGNTCYGYQTLRLRWCWQGEAPNEVPVTSIHHLWILQEGLRCDINNSLLFEPISVIQNLYSNWGSVPIPCAPQIQTTSLGDGSHRDE